MSNFIARLKDDDPYFEMSAGDVLLLTQADYDCEKAIVICRWPDGFDPGCSVYWHQVDSVYEVPE